MNQLLAAIAGLGGVLKRTRTSTFEWYGGRGRSKPTSHPDAREAPCCFIQRLQPRDGGRELFDCFGAK
jgi:hypothetical protein